MTRLEFLIEGHWVAPISPPPAFARTPLEAYRGGNYAITGGLEFNHPTLGLISAVPGSFPCRLADTQP